MFNDLIITIDLTKKLLNLSYDFFFFKLCVEVRFNIQEGNNFIQ